MKLVDYFFYRIFSFYKKHPNELPKLRGMLITSLVVFLSILSAISLLSLSSLTDNITKIKPFLLVIMIMLFIPFYLRYRNNSKIEILTQKYKSEDLKKKHIRGWILCIYLFLVLLIPISIGFLRHNLGMEI